MPAYKKSVFDLGSGPGESVLDYAEQERLQRQQLAQARLQQALEFIQGRRSQELQGASIANQAHQFQQGLDAQTRQQAMDRALQEKLASMTQAGFDRKRVSEERIAAADRASRERLTAGDRALQERLALMVEGGRSQDRQLDALFKAAGIGLEEDRLRFAREQAGAELGFKQQTHLDDLAQQFWKRSFEERSHADTVRLKEHEIGARGNKQSTEEKFARQAAVRDTIEKIMAEGTDGLKKLPALAAQLAAEDPDAARMLRAFLESPAFKIHVVDVASPSRRKFDETSPYNPMIAIRGMRVGLGELMGWEKDIHDYYRQAMDTLDAMDKRPDGAPPVQQAGRLSADEALRNRAQDDRYGVAVPPFFSPDPPRASARMSLAEQFHPEEVGRVIRTIHPNPKEPLTPEKVNLIMQLLRAGRDEAYPQQGWTPRPSSAPRPPAGNWAQFNAR